MGFRNPTQLQTIPEKFLQQAIGLALANVESGRGGPFGAVIVKNGEVIATAANTVTTDNDPTAHAEVNAIRAACNKLGTFRLEGCELYTSCEPCPMCMGAIYWARIDKVWYAAGQAEAANAGFDDSFIYREIAIDHSRRRIPFLHLGGKDANAPFEAWIRNENKTNY